MNCFMLLFVSFRSKDSCDFREHSIPFGLPQKLKTLEDLELETTELISSFYKGYLNSFPCNKQLNHSLKLFLIF